MLAVASVDTSPDLSLQLSEWPGFLVYVALLPTKVSVFHHILALSSQFTAALCL